jgi:hypothetical protein
MSLSLVANGTIQITTVIIPEALHPWAVWRIEPTK